MPIIRPGYKYKHSQYVNHIRHHVDLIQCFMQAWQIHKNAFESGVCIFCVPVSELTSDSVGALCLVVFVVIRLCCFCDFGWGCLVYMTVY